MKKQLLLLLVMLLPMVASADVVEIDGIYYNLVKKAKEAEVAPNPKNYSGDIVIPATVDYGDISYNVTKIQSSAFSNCSELKSIKIGVNVTEIGEFAFSSCSNLILVSLPDGLKKLGVYAFSYCEKLTSIYLPDGLEEIGNYTFWKCESLVSIIIPQSVTTLGWAAFCQCAGLQSVTLSNGLITIGDSAFYMCEKLKDMILPSTVEKIGHSAFMGCTSLTNMDIPNSVSSIDHNAFAGCSSLSSVSIPNNITSISSNTFSGCSSLSTAIVPKSVSSIGQGAFSSCTSLTTITIPDGVNTIGGMAFYNCSSLTSTTLGSGIETINSEAFGNCKNLENVYCYAVDVPSTSSNAFKDSYIEYVTLHVPDASVNLYKAAEPWQNFKEIVGLGGTPSVTQKCATPTITVVDGKLLYSCETEGVSFKTNYSYNSGNSEVDGAEVVLTGTTNCHVSVYATKEGYLDSEIAAIDVELSVGKKGDVNADGVVSIADAVSVLNIILNDGGAQAAPALEKRIQNQSRGRF